MWSRASRARSSCDGHERRGGRRGGRPEPHWSRCRTGRVPTGGQGHRAMGRMTQAVAPGAHARGANPASVGRRWTSRVARNECCGNPACRACQSAVRGPPSGLPLSSPRSFTLLAPSATGRFSSGPPISSGANRPGPRNTPCAPAADVDSRCGPQYPRRAPLPAWPPDARITRAVCAAAWRRSSSQDRHPTAP